MNERLHRWERGAIVLLFGAIVAFGVVVEIRTAFLERRMGDLSCYLRAAWAVRADVNMYDIVEDNGWHYNYPPLYAILMTPLADPPQGSDTTGYVPYAVSAGICYALNVLWLVIGVHWLANALERHMGGEVARFGRRWWMLRTLPVFVCIASVGHTLSRGQVNTLMLMLVCGLIAGLMTGRSFLAGLSLAGAICLKIIPVFLLLVPLWRRDGRCLAGVAVGLVVGLGVIPLAVLGPTRTVDGYYILAKGVLGPAVGLGTDRTRGEELIDATATDSQSFRTAIHAAIHPDPVTRPKDASSRVKWAAIGLGGILMLLTFRAFRGRRRNESGPTLVLFVGSLSLVMLLVSPVSHLHYFVLEIPLIMVLLVRDWARKPALTESLLVPGRAGSPLSVGTFLLFLAVLLGNLLPQLPIFLTLRDRGAAGMTALLLWIVVWRTLSGRASESPAVSTAVKPGALPLAA